MNPKNSHFLPNFKKRFIKNLNKGQRVAKNNLLWIMEIIFQNMELKIQKYHLKKKKNQNKGILILNNLYSNR